MGLWLEKVVDGGEKLLEVARAIIDDVGIKLCRCVSEGLSMSLYVYNMPVCLCSASLLSVFVLFRSTCFCIRNMFFCLLFLSFFHSELFMSSVLFMTQFPFSLPVSVYFCPSLCLPVSLSQSKADGDVLDYKQFAALPRVKAIYERPDIIPYQADHSHTRLSDDTLERYSCGQVHTHTHTHNQL